MRSGYLMVREKQSISDDDIFSPRCSEDDDFGDVFGRQRLTSTTARPGVSRLSHEGIADRDTYAYTASALDLSP